MRWIALGGSALLIVLAAILMTSGTAEGEVAPGVQTLDRDLGGMTTDQARAEIAKAAAEFATTPLVLVIDGRGYSTPAGQLGIAIDVEASTLAVAEAGHSGFDALIRPLRLSGELSITPVLSIDRDHLQKTMDWLLGQAGMASANARFSYANGQLTLVPAVPGKVVDLDQLERDLRAGFDGRVFANIPVTLMDVPARIGDADLQPVLERAQSYVGLPITFSYNGWEYELAPDAYAPYLMVAFDDAGAAMLDLDPAYISQVSTQVKAALDRAPVDAAIVDGGQYGRIQEATPGLTVNAEALAGELQTEIRVGSHRVIVPVLETAPNVSADGLLADKGITTLLGTGTSDFTGSDDGRITNIEVASRLIDGLLVPPGADFSFNYSIGSIVDVPGYVPAGASENGIPGTAVGGGVCQVSTTVFRAALKAGMPIPERWPHAYRSTYYEQGGWAPGFDASIQQPEGDPFGGSDFKFTNMTDGWLLIRSAVVDETLTVEIYGVQTGYTVELDDPLYEDYWVGAFFPEEEVDATLPAGTVIEVQPERDGVTMVVRRRVYDANGTLLLEDAFVSEYTAAPAVYRVSPDMAGSTQDGE